ncbi:MAG: D-tyrosyl-tRNA(Tyr) deacylase [Candidatus Dormibacteraeota bacterium]|nr:D-tyrosyl-tRNA(Tyr) deacylase [Candidatus Dormibacteraeota bacterium]
MRAVVQRVTEAAVGWSEPAGECREQIGLGLAVLVGAGPQDGFAEAERLADKVAALRIFADADGRFNRSLEDVGGAALVVSQFTLYADATRGRRPSFISAAPPELATRLVDRFAERLRERGVPTRTGRFGAHMTVTLANDGPVTLVLSTEPWETRINA